MTKKRKGWLYKTINFESGGRASLNYAEHDAHVLLFGTLDTARALDTTEGALRARQKELRDNGDFREGFHYVHVERTEREIYQCSPDKIIKSKKDGRTYSFVLFTIAGLRKLARSYISDVDLIKRIEKIQEVLVPVTKDPQPPEPVEKLPPQPPLPEPEVPPAPAPVPAPKNNEQEDWDKVADAISGLGELAQKVRQLTPQGDEIPPAIEKRLAGIENRLEAIEHVFSGKVALQLGVFDSLKGQTLPK